MLGQNYFTMKVWIRSNQTNKFERRDHQWVSTSWLRSISQQFCNEATTSPITTTGPQLVAVGGGVSPPPRSPNYF
jgi:hypothetical protein